MSDDAWNNFVKEAEDQHRANWEAERAAEKALKTWERQQLDCKSRRRKY